MKRTYPYLTRRNRYRKFTMWTWTRKMKAVTTSRTKAMTNNNKNLLWIRAKDSSFDSEMSMNTGDFLDAFKKFLQEEYDLANPGTSQTVKRSRSRNRQPPIHRCGNTCYRCSPQTSKKEKSWFGWLSRRLRYHRESRKNRWNPAAWNCSQHVQ